MLNADFATEYKSQSTQCLLLFIFIAQAEKEIESCGNMIYWYFSARLCRTREYFGRDHSKTFEFGLLASLRRGHWEARSYLTMGSLVKGTGGSLRPSGRVMTSIPPGHLEV